MRQLPRPSTWHLNWRSNSHPVKNVILKDIYVGHELTLSIHMPKHTTCLGRNYYFKTRDFSYHIPEINAQLPCARLVLHGSCVVKDLSACIVLCFHIIPQQIFCLVLTACKYINMSMNFFSKESK